MKPSDKSYTTRDLFTGAEVETPAHALSPQERKMLGLTRARKYKKKTDTSHVRWS